jgi:hypothetical protein
LAEGREVRARDDHAEDDAVDGFRFFSLHV